MTTNTLDLIDDAIADLEAKLNLAPGEIPKGQKAEASSKKDSKKPKKEKPQKQQKKQQPAAANTTQPDICKLEFKVGVITKVWVHPQATKLYCEEIDVGEDTGPRQIASGLRPHYTLKEMMGRRLLVVTNLKAKTLMGFKSHGMVLCAASAQNEDGSSVELIEPPKDASIGQVITFEGLPPPEPLSASQVEKKKVFATCVKGMKTTDKGEAAWNDHVFMTLAGPCTCPTIKGGVMR